MEEMMYNGFEKRWHGERASEVIDLYSMDAFLVRRTEKIEKSDLTEEYSAELFS